jgi:cytidylate kinase
VSGTVAPVVTVDGPAGSGKSTLGRALARSLGLPLVDTGLFYRGVMVAAVRAGVDASDAAALERLVRGTDIRIGTDPWLAEEVLKVDGIDATTVMRDPRHARLLAQVSSTAEVRVLLRPRQRELAAGGAVAVGRDCGTVVFAGAPVKFYLEAPEEVRRRRRTAQLSARGTETDSADIAAEIGERDRIDSDRAVAPLRPAPDAHVIDTGAMGIDEMVSTALRRCDERGIRPARAG